mmetsp:Transcript_130442/g.225539  ORF Transcript_130442/g.225539 Transcript_130442/m.225539 type:complete len:214 (-) Transcript_130442:84-725(-)
MLSCLPSMVRWQALKADIGVAALGPWAMFLGNALLLLNLLLIPTIFPPGAQAPSLVPQAVLWILADTVCMAGCALLPMDIGALRRHNSTLPAVASAGAVITATHASLCIFLVHQLMKEVEQLQFGYNTGRTAGLGGALPLKVMRIMYDSSDSQPRTRKSMAFWPLCLFVLVWIWYSYESGPNRHPDSRAPKAGRAPDPLRQRLIPNKPLNARA